eukprot:8653655-Ditylum_brightwellii.AAC.1
MLGRRPNIAFDHWLTVKGGKLEIEIEHFSSTTFTSYYLTEQLPSSVRLSSLQMMQSFFELLTSIDNVVEYINTNGTWTVVGWYKHGVVNDKTGTKHSPLSKEDTKVDSGELSYHGVYLGPTNNFMPNKDSNLGKELIRKNLMFPTLTKQINLLLLT